MRSMLLSIMFCLISSVSWAEAVSWADLVENPGDGLVYKKFLTMPFTGVVIATADDPVQHTKMALNTVNGLSLMQTAW